MSTETAGTVVSPAKASAQSALKENLRDYGLVLALIAIMVFFQFTTNGTLFKPVNLTNLVLQNSYIIIMALGMLLVIVAGHIDLSVGSVSGFVGAVAAVLMVQYHVNPFLAGLLCLIVGGIIGASQGYWIAYMKIPSFIVTLAGMLVFKGLALWLLGGMSVGPFPAEFQLLSAGFIPDAIGPVTIAGVKLHSTTLVIGIAIVAAMLYFSLRSRRSRESHGYEAEPFALFVIKNAVISAIVLFLIYMMASYRGLPNVLIVMGVLIALFVFITKRMTIGRRIYAMGGNVKAAAAVRHQDRAADLHRVHHHGRAVGAGRPDLCRPPQHRDAEGGPRLRARRDRRGVHRRRLRHGRRRPGRRRSHRRLHHGRHEQRHVDHGRQHRLAAGHQGPGAARRRGIRRLQQEQGLRQRMLESLRRDDGRGAAELSARQGEPRP